MWCMSPARPLPLRLFFLFLLSSPVHLVPSKLSDSALDFPDDGEQGHQRHALGILEPEMAEAVWARMGSKNPLRRTTTVPLTDLLDTQHAGSPQQQKEKTTKRLPRAVAMSEYDSLNDDFLTEYDLLNLDFSLDEEPKRNAKEVEVPAKEVGWEDGEKPAEFPPKEWWDLEESATTTRKETTAATERPKTRETGRRRRAARLKVAGVVNVDQEWPGEAVARDQVKVWPRLVPSSTARTTRKPPTPSSTPVALISNPPNSNPIARRIVGGEEDGKNGARGRKDPAKKQEQNPADLFRDLPAGVEVVSSLVEKAVEIQNPEPTSQRQKNTDPKSRVVGAGPQHQQIPPFSRVLNHHSSAGAFAVRHSGQAGTSTGQPQQSPALIRQQQQQLVDSFPTIVLGEQPRLEPPLTNSGQSKFVSQSGGASPPFQSPSEAIASIDQGLFPPPQVQAVPLPPGFVHLATLDSLPKEGPLVIGDQRYEIQQTLPYRHFFPEQPNRKVNNNEFKTVLPQLIDFPILETTKATTAAAAGKEEGREEPPVTTTKNTEVRKRGRRVAATHKKASPQHSPERHNSPAERHKLLRQFAVDNFPSSSGIRTDPKGFPGKAGALALNLGSALSQIFGNFSLPTAEKGARGIFGGGGGIEEVESEPYRLTRVFEKKSKAGRTHSN